MAACVMWVTPPAMWDNDTVVIMAAILFHEDVNHRLVGL
jgi:hypothetical protein